MQIEEKPQIEQTLLGNIILSRALSLLPRVVYFTLELCHSKWLPIYGYFKHSFHVQEMIWTMRKSTNGPFFSTTTNDYALDPLLANFALRNYVIKVYLSPGSIFKTKRVGLKESIHNMYEYIWVFNRFIFLSNIRVCF